jgi:Peptidase C13 family
VTRVLGRAVLLFVLATIGRVPLVGAKETYLVILTGIPGEEEYRQKFHDWSMSMRRSAIDHYGLSQDHVFYLGASPELAPDAIYAKSAKENVVALFKKLEHTVRPGDQLYVLLIGHGSYDEGEPRFNLPGPDLTAADFEALLAPFTEQQIVFVDTTSASGGFLAPLAKKNRVLVTSTKSGFERNESQFGGYFVEAYSGGADFDKNQRVSVLEAFEYARKKVDGYYSEENLLKTEHAQLDDDGDAKGIGEAAEPGNAGTPAEKAQNKDGALAGATYLMGAAALAEGIAPEAVAADPELARLVENKRDLEGRVEALKLQKESMPEPMYMEELEKILLELAAVNESIESRTKK